MNAQIDKWHLTARTSFVPFCVAVFTRERLSHSGQIPGERKEALDKESLTALEGILREVLLQKLIELGGWKKLDVYFEERRQSKRLWEVDFSIIISSRVIQWLMFIHNNEWSKASQLEPSTAGDMFLYDLVFSQVTKNRRFKIDGSVFERSHLTNVLNFKSTDHSPLIELKLFVPWLEGMIIRRWLTANEKIWYSRKAFVTGLETQTALFKSMIEADEVNLFSLLCQWFCLITKHGLNRERTLLENFKSELNFLKDKQALEKLWLSNLLIIEDLYGKFENYTKIHPVDRTELDKFYLDIWNKKEMNRARAVILSINADVNQLTAGEIES